MFCKELDLISCELVLSPLLDVSLLNAELKAGRHFRMNWTQKKRYKRSAVDDKRVASMLC